MDAAGHPKTPNRSGYRALQRQFGDFIQTASTAGTTASLESVSVATTDPPRLASARILEGSVLRAHPVPIDTTPGFGAFVDGIQESRIIGYAAMTPIVHGLVGAVVRRRADRRLMTWAHAFEARLYAPKAFLSADVASALSGCGETVVDITPRRSDGDADEGDRHPYAISESAVNAVRKHREQLEGQLAERWIGEMREPLYVDGGISGTPALAASPLAVGVIKSHRTLYGDATTVERVLQLRLAERTSVFEVTSSNRWRSPVASWYLRVRDHAGHDPLHGLVRIEATLEGNASLTARADELSAWVLAESTPLSLPDSRWDTMAYGIRDCEQFLKSML